MRLKHGFQRWLRDVGRVVRDRGCRKNSDHFQQAALIKAQVEEFTLFGLIDAAALLDQGTREFR